ncbi:hypothetical protein S40293_11151 [Stachybotrys chartarum IBT 40293]|nr:hypothetical protein S40293_11151 [Stachybotrys chartarum IBT 40293]KFA70820.1 hypothetical protein S40288_11581 [Stachybotrys chartarum IBT 40288]
MQRQLLAAILLCSTWSPILTTYSARKSPDKSEAHIAMICQWSFLATVGLGLGLASIVSAVPQPLTEKNSKERQGISRNVTSQGRDLRDDPETGLRTVFVPPPPANTVATITTITKPFQRFYLRMARTPMAGHYITHDDMKPNSTITRMKYHWNKERALKFWFGNDKRLYFRNPHGGPDIFVSAAKEKRGTKNVYFVKERFKEDYFSLMWKTHPEDGGLIPVNPIDPVERLLTAKCRGIWIVATKGGYPWAGWTHLIVEPLDGQGFEY